MDCLGSLICFPVEKLSVLGPKKVLIFIDA